MTLSSVFSPDAGWGESLTFTAVCGLRQAFTRILFMPLINECSKLGFEAVK